MCFARAKGTMDYSFVIEFSSVIYSVNSLYRLRSALLLVHIQTLFARNWCRKSRRGTTVRHVFVRLYLCYLPRELPTPRALASYDGNVSVFSHNRTCTCNVLSGLRPVSKRLDFLNWELQFQYSSNNLAQGSINILKILPDTVYVYAYIYIQNFPFSIIVKISGGYIANELRRQCYKNRVVSITLLSQPAIKFVDTTRVLTSDTLLTGHPELKILSVISFSWQLISRVSEISSLSFLRVIPRTLSLHYLSTRVLITYRNQAFRYRHDLLTNISHNDVTCNVRNYVSDHVTHY